MARKPPKWPRKVVSGQSLVTIYQTKIGSLLRYQLRWMELGEVHRQTTTDEAAAIDMAQRVADRLCLGESSAMNLDAPTAAVYRHALTFCGDVPLDAWCRELSEAKKRLGAVPLLHAIDDYIARHRGTSVPLNQAVDGFVASRKGLSDVYTVRLADRLAHLKTDFGCRLLSEITEQEIRAFVEKQGGSPRNRKNMRDAIVTVWRWARREGYLPRDMQTEAERVEAPVIKRAERIEIFTSEEMTKLLTAAASHIRPVIAICGFAGVRSQGEITRLRWEDVKWDRNVIDVAGKTGERRFAPIQPNLAAWLSEFRSATGPVTAIQPDKAFLRTANAAGIEWKHNGLRHSFGSYRVAMTKSVDQTSLEMGNSPRIVRKNYLEAVHEDQAAEWFGIMPPTCG